MVFITTYLLLIGSATPALLIADTEGVYVPPTFALNDALQPTQFQNYTTFKVNLTEFTTWNDLVYAKSVSIGGVNVLFELEYYNSTYYALAVNLLGWEFLGLYYAVRTSIFAPDGSFVGFSITHDQMDHDYANTTLQYTASASDVTIHLRIAVPDAYETPSAAFQAGELHVFAGVNPILDTGGQAVGGNFISNLQAIFAFAVDGRIPPLLSALIFGPVFIAGGYILFIAITKSIHGG